MPGMGRTTGAGADALKERERFECAVPGAISQVEVQSLRVGPESARLVCQLTHSSISNLSRL